MDKIKRVAIVGVGLLGASLGLAFKKFTSVSQIAGYDKESRHLNIALEIGAIDEKISNFTSDSSVLSEADLVILATPVGAISKLLKQIQPQLKSGTIVTDVGSTKSWISEKIKLQLRKDITYIPAHPMTGSEVSGPWEADSYLFENAIYVLTPFESTPEEEVEPLVELLEKIGARILFMSPRKHDQIVAAVSHLPHIIACSLVDAIGEAANEDERIFSLTSGGFRDTTRIASGDPTMWTDICLSNVQPIQQMIKILKEKLAEFEVLLDEKDYKNLFNKFEQIRDLRREIPKKKQGLIPPTYEILLTIPDRPNAIGKVTSLLGKEGVNITDIEILRVRERGGTLRLAFATEEELETAEKLLTEANYNVKEK